MKYFYVISIALLCLSCNQETESNAQNQKSNTPLLTMASSFKTSDTIYIEALGNDMNEIRFNIKTIEVDANKEVTVALTNKSSDASMPHNFVVIVKDSANAVGQNGVRFKENGYVNPQDKNVLVHSPIANLNETIYISFLTPSKGEYEFICSYPGHWGKMIGNFVVI